MRLTPWVTRLIVANVLVFILIPGGSLYYALMVLYPPAVIGMDQGFLPALAFRPWTLVTYMFLHGGIGHLLFNMIGLFFFGPRLEEKLGSRRFLGLYFGAGLGAALFSFIFAWGSPVVGASGAVYGILAGFAMFWPKEPIYIYGILPIQARVLAGIVVFFSLYAGISGAEDGTAHFAHLGGLIVGAAYLKLVDFRQTKDRREFQKKVDSAPSEKYGEREVVRRWTAIDMTSLHEINRGEVQELLQRVQEEGLKSLSKDERQFLDRMAGFYG